MTGTATPTHDIRIVPAASSPEAAGRVVDRIEELQRAQGSLTLGVATGSSPLGVYAEMARRGSVDTERLTAFALDEYVGLPADHPQRYRSVLERDFCTPLGVDPRRLFVPTATSEHDADAGGDFETTLHAHGGVDLQLLGIGSNGHIAFNEPGSSPLSRTRIQELAASTRRDNARFFAALDDVPRTCITQGIATILEAREIVVLAFGAAKADALARALRGMPTTDVPASFLQWHPRVTVHADADALAHLR